MKKDNCILFIFLLFTNLILAAKPGKAAPGTIVQDPYQADFVVFEDVCSYHSISFQNLTTNLGQSYAVDWDFGDLRFPGDPDNISHEENPSHKFSSPGTYTVTLKVRWDYSPYQSTIIKEVVIKPCCPDLSISTTTGCVGQAINFNYAVNSGDIPSDNTVFDWDFGDGSAHSNLARPSHRYVAASSYHVILKTYVKGLIVTDTCVFYMYTGNTDCAGSGNGEFGGCLVVNTCPIDEQPCCDGSFAPTPGERYVLSAWVKEDITGVFIYPHPSISLLFSGATPTLLGPFYPKGDIIEGWQRIETDFVVPDKSTAIRVDLNNEGDNDVFFDDIRIHPYRANVKSFVYDPISLRLVAELDENNYATVFEYNEEGELVRVKKETERGVMTIKESRNSNKKKNY